MADMTLQEKMLLYRARVGISQTELARRCGVTLQTINSIENGKQKPSKLTLAKIRSVVDDNFRKEYGGDHAEN